jgi:hypothetical protein
MDAEIPSKLCGRPFGEAEPERIRREIVKANPPRRAEIAWWVSAARWIGRAHWDRMPVSYGTIALLNVSVQRPP